MEIILASQSARRREILETLGLKFTVMVSDADETMPEGTPPGEFVRAVSARKAEAVKKAISPRFTASNGDSVPVDDLLIIASDTVVVCEGEILGKPRDRADGERMMRLLSGSTHKVVSGIAVCYRGETVCDHEETAVTFRALSDRDVSDYLSTDEPYDKAGGYGIQNKAAVFVESICGDYLNVVGLPVFRLFRLLEERFGLNFFQLAKEGEQR